MSLSEIAPIFHSLLQTQQLNQEQLAIYIGHLMHQSLDVDKNATMKNEPSIIIYGSGHGKTLLAKFIQELVSPTIQVHNVGTIHEFQDICFTSKSPFIVTTNSFTNIDTRILSDSCLVLHFQIPVASQIQDSHIYAKLNSELSQVRNHCARAYLNNLYR